MNNLNVIRKIATDLNVNLVKLEKLELGSRGYTLDKYGNVAGLALFDCEIIELEKVISNIQILNLTYLNLSSNRISDISSLKYLVELTDLYLVNNRISDISPLKNLVRLSVLDLKYNQITDISVINGLENLISLNIKANRISDIPPLKVFNKLSMLDLSDNRIKKLPSWITDFHIEFGSEQIDHGINLFNNPLEVPPIVIVKQGMHAIRNYFEQLAKQGMDNIYEAKLMVVGEPGSGKTTLINKLFDKTATVPDTNQKSTLGINVRPNWIFPVSDKYEFKGHTWDFGGQQIQYMLHQFFLTSNCLYILMAEKRRELANFDYWLNIINILGKKSPVLVVFNEIDIESANNFVYDEKKYTELFPNLNISKLDVNLADMEDGRFEVLEKTIKQKLSKLEHIGKEVPARWVDIRRELENLRTQKYITISKYFQICNQYHVNNEADRELILRYFHLLGIVLHFSEDENLCDILFLDPNWTVDAVYSVLTDNEIEKNSGIFWKSDINRIWKEKGYDYEERVKLLRLMLKDNFDICYKLSGSKDKYIVPLLLPKKKPDFIWDESNNLQFRFQYPFMPKGIVSRLIVRLHFLVDNKYLWHEGAVFHMNSAMAQIVERITKKEGLKIIDIRLRGIPDDRKELLTHIREEIRKIQDSSFPALPYSEMVPCNCNDCESGGEAEFYDYQDLKNLLKKYKHKVQCRKSGDMLDIDRLIDAVGLKAIEIDRQNQTKMQKDMIDKLDYLSQKLDYHDKKLDKHDEKTDRQYQTILSKIESEHRNTVNSILDELDENDIMTVEYLYQQLEQKKIPDMEILQVLINIEQAVEDIQSNDLKQLARVLEPKTDSMSSKFKLKIPIIPVLLSFEQEISVNQFLLKFWQKTKNCIL